MEFPILAAGDDIIGVIVGVIFLLISAASAIGNIAKEKNKPQPGKVKEKAALQKELEKFLQEAMNPQAEKKGKPVEVDSFEDDVQATTSVPQPPARRRREKQPSRPQRRRAQQGSKTVSPQKTVKEPKVQVSARERAELQEEARQKRLGGSMRDRIEKSQKKHLQSRIHRKADNEASRPQSDLFGSKENETRHSSDGKRGGSRQLRELLRDRKSFQQAIILNEILSPPLSRRRS